MQRRRKAAIMLTAGLTGTRSLIHDGLSANFLTGSIYTRASGGALTQYTTAQSLFTWSSSTKYTRNASGLLVASGANTPAYEWNFSGALQGIKLEGSRTNLNTQSADQGNAAWNKSGLTASSAGVGPYNNTMTTLTETIATLAHQCISTNWAGTSGSVYTASAWIRKGTRRYVMVGLYAATGTIFVTVDTSNWTISQQATASGTGTATANSGVLEQWGTDLYRVSVSGSFSVAGPYNTIIAGSNTATPTVLDATVYLGDGSTIIVSDIQSELGAFVSSYIPTTTGTVVRNSDAVYADATQSWFNAAQGTLFSQNNIRSPSFQVALAFSNDVSYALGSGLLLRINSNAIGGIGGNATTVSVTGASSSTAKLAGGYQGTTMKLARNGSGVTSASTLDFTGVGTTRFYLGRLGVTDAQNFFDHIQRIDYYPTLLSDDQLTGLST